eukprot:4109450-Pleurochrysis_carterae.AAC.2
MLRDVCSPRQPSPFVTAFGERLCGSDGSQCLWRCHAFRSRRARPAALVFLSCAQCGHACQWSHATLRLRSLKLCVNP